MALNNDGCFHLAAILKRGKSVIRIGVNQKRENGRFLRVVDGMRFAYLHAEMDALIAARPGDTLIVYRWKKNGQLSMAKPCKHCVGHIREAGIRKVIFSHWDGKLYTKRF